MHAIEHVLILGAGWVGRQVAARMAQFGIEIWLVDRDEQAIASALQWIRDIPANAASPSNWISRIHVATTMRAFAETGTQTDTPRIDLVIESVPEQISLKKRVLREASQILGPPTIIASNSSYFVPSLLCGFVDHPSRFAHIHFHVPVLEDSVVDIVGCAHTSSDVIEQLKQLVVTIGQEPLVLRHEHPGYVFNWLLQSVLRSALELTALDVADPAEIDKSWTAVTGMPLGPFGIMDQIGLDVIEQVLSNARWAAPPEVKTEQLLALLSAHTSQGHLGVKTKHGFYEYGEGHVT